MPSASRWPDAALAGVASSMRTFAAPAALAARGRVTGKARVATLALTAGELAGDKIPGVPDRTDPPGLIGRLGAGAYVGRELAGPAGAAAGAIGAGVGCYGTYRARRLVVERTGLPDQVAALGEDVVALSIAMVATRPDPPEAGEEEAPPERSLVKDAATGLAAGLAGTAAMTLAQGMEYQLTSAKPSTAPAQVGGKIKRALGFGRLKRRHVPVANQIMHWGYGTSWGIPYGLLASGARVKPEISGPAWGLFVWGAALAQQPALGIAEAPWKRSLQSLGSEALFHVVYGAGAAGALRALRRR